MHLNEKFAIKSLKHNNPEEAWKYVNNDMMPPSHAVMFYIHPQQWSYLPQPFWLNVHNIDDIGYSCPTKCANFGSEEFHSV